MISIPTPEVRVSARGAARVRSSHPWVFRDDVADSDARNGDVVRVSTAHGAFLGHAFYSSASKIALRFLSRAEEAPDERFWESRVADALAYRSRVVEDAEGYRILFGESDGIPGLVADLYGRHLVVQPLTMGAERVLGPVLAVLEERIGPESVLARRDAAVRALEGLPREVVQLRGHTPESVDVREGPIRYDADPWKGQKTGAFLDQRENRSVAARYSCGRVLDVFSYHASFALHAAAHAEEVIAVDSSAEAIARGRENAQANGVSRIAFVEANAFDDLRERQRRGEKFDMVVLDPPAFAKSRADVPAARRGYKEINLRAMQILAPGGILVTCSCSYNLSEEEFSALVASAAADAHLRFRVVEKRTQARDHPIRLGFPESHYLKCLILQLA